MLVWDCVCVKNLSAYTMWAHGSNYVSHTCVFWAIHITQYRPGMAAFQPFTNLQPTNKYTTLTHESLSVWAVWINFWAYARGYVIETCLHVISVSCKHFEYSHWQHNSIFIVKLYLLHKRACMVIQVWVCVCSEFDTLGNVMGRSNRTITRVHESRRQ